jgi:hypothetical protein
LAAIRLAATINEKKFGIFANGPAMLEVNRLREDVRALKENNFDDRGRLKQEWN